MFPPIRTGTSFYSKNIADAVVKNGHQVTVVTVSNADAVQGGYNFPVHRLSAIHFPVKNYFKHLRFCSLSIKNYSRLWRVADDMSADVIVLVNHYLDIAFPAIFASLKNKISLIVSVGTQLQSLNPFRHKILNILDKIICGTFIFPFCQKIISWDREIERYIREVQGEGIVKKSVIVPFGVNGDIAEYQQHHHSYEHHHQILGIGAVIDHRNFLFQIRTFKEILALYPSMHLKIIGHVYIDSPLQLVKELQLQDKITFAGELPHEQVLHELKNSDLHWMMLTSKYTGLGTSNLEAMLMGVPIISNIPEDLFGENVLRDMTDYIYTDGKSIEAIVSKLQQVLSGIHVRREIGQNGRAFVQEHMNWDTIAQKLETVLLSAINP